MKGINRIAKGMGTVTLALLAGALMPILIWVALGVLMRPKAQERKVQRAPAPTIGEILAAAGLTIHEEAAAGRPVAARIFKRQSVPEIRGLLARAGLTIHDEAVPKHYPEPELFKV